MSKRAFYSNSIQLFLTQSVSEILGSIQELHSQDIVHLQTSAWKAQIEILQQKLSTLDNGEIYFEFLIPRMGRRADVILLYQSLIFVFEFKVGENKYLAHDLRQAHDYALDLSNFHEGSHNQIIIPVLIATEATEDLVDIFSTKDKVFQPLKANKNNILTLIENCINKLEKQPYLDSKKWFNSSYKPTPTIIEAAQALYANHNVEDISRNDAGATNLNITSKRIKEIIHLSKINKQKSICFVTGVPGAGKTLVGLNIATKRPNQEEDELAIFLSGNGPLVQVLREALVRDKVARKEAKTKKEAKSEVESFIQNVHHFRDEALIDKKAPKEKVVIFDEAQRAWDKHQTSKHMRNKKGQADFNQSEPDFLISVMNRHQDWCVIIALVGGGQEIYTGEAGIAGWLEALSDKYTGWDVYYSDKLNQKEYVGNIDTQRLKDHQNYHQEGSLHLGTSIRSFKAERLSHMIHHIIANDSSEASNYYKQFKDRFPIKITRDLQQAKQWIKNQSRANETKGIIASSGAIRLKPEGLFVKHELSAPIYFLNDQADIRSCHFLEDVATEFDIQGLELDWCLVCWDADYRYTNNQFEHRKFSGTKWQYINNKNIKRYLENAYRVLLTRARQGMVIYIPSGNKDDYTRKPEFYDETYLYLMDCGIESL